MLHLAEPSRIANDLGAHHYKVRKVLLDVRRGARDLPSRAASCALYRRSRRTRTDRSRSQRIHAGRAAPAIHPHGAHKRVDLGDNCTLGLGKQLVLFGFGAVNARQVAESLPGLIE